MLKKNSKIELEQFLLETDTPPPPPRGKPR